MRAPGVQLQGDGGKAVLLGLLRAARHERIAIAGRLRLRSPRMQKNLNLPRFPRRLDLRRQFCGRL
jgi:hypothetical protein